MEEKCVGLLYRRGKKLFRGPNIFTPVFPAKDSSRGLSLVGTNEEALYVVDALCHHESDLHIQEHYTDLPQPQYYDQIGKLFLKQARNQDALDIYEQAIQAITEGHFSLYVGKGYALLQLERYDEALVCYQSAIKLNALEVNPQFYHDLGILYERLAQFAYTRERKQSIGRQTEIEKEMFFLPTALDATKLVLFHTLGGQEQEITNLAFSPDSKTLISGSHDNTLRFWEVPSGRTLHTLKVHRNAINGMAISSDGKTIAIGSRDKVIRLWDLPFERLKDALIGHRDEVLSVAFSPNGELLASGSGDNTIMHWRPDSEALWDRQDTLPGHTGAVLSVAFSPDGKLLASTSEDKA